MTFDSFDDHAVYIVSLAQIGEHWARLQDEICTFRLYAKMAKRIAAKFQEAGVFV